MSHRSEYRHDPAISIITGVCPHDCPDTCSWQVAVHADGRAVDIWGHPDHPVTGGMLCTKVDRYLERTYHTGRLLHPLKRSGPKGSGCFTRVSWEQALSEIAERLHRVIDEFGAESVLPYSYAGTMGLLQGEGVAQRFFNRMGASLLARTICSEAGFEGYVYSIGATEGITPEAFAHAQLILIWGSNTLTSNVHLWPFIQRAKKQGARVIAIDPARTRTARLADEWIPIRPGTDGALALAMMHVIVGEDLVDKEYVAAHTIGFDALVQRVAEWTPKRAAVVTGIPASCIRSLARQYATTRPAALRLNYGMQRHAGGGMAVRTIACLPALTGAWRDHGGGLQLSTSGAFRDLDRTSITRPDLLGNRRPRTINMNRLGDALSLNPAQIARSLYHPRPADPSPLASQAGTPVKTLIVYNCNPAAVCPDQNSVLEGLRRDDLFTVVLEQFQTDTADYADFVLPATTQLEHWDIVKPYGHLYLGLNRPAIAPLSESLPNSEIFRRLARAMGYEEACFDETDEAILRTFVEGQTHERFAEVTWEKLQKDGFARLNVPDPYLPFATGGFPTPSGKCEFYSERMAQDGYDPVPTYTPPAWQQSAFGANGSTAVGAESDEPGHHQAPNAIPSNSRAKPDSLPGTLPLVCISPPAHSFLNSSFANLERFIQREEMPRLQIHPEDATQRSIQNGTSVRVWNDMGNVILTAEVSEDIMPGTLLAPGIWWAKFSPNGTNINQITPQTEADMGSGACFYDTLVFITPLPDGGTGSPEAGAVHMTTGQNQTTGSPAPTASLEIATGADRGYEHRAGT